MQVCSTNFNQLHSQTKMKMGIYSLSEASEETIGHNVETALLNLLLSLKYNHCLKYECYKINHIILFSEKISWRCGAV